MGVLYTEIIRTDMVDRSEEMGRDGPSPNQIEEPSGDLFELINHELRIDILTALVDRRRADPDSSGCSYSELLNAVGNPDSGQFHYHLSRLRPQLISKTDEGYCLSVAGRRITGTLLAGTYGEDDVSVSGTLEQSCPTCDAPFNASFEYGLFHVTCSSGHVDLTTGYPEGVVHGRTIRDIAAVAAQTIRQDVERALEGLCPHCFGCMQPSIEYEDEYRFTALCERCGMLFQAPVGFAIISHPSVVSFLYERGYDPRTRPPWTFGFCLSDDAVKRIETEPLLLRIHIEANGEYLDVDVDDTGRVIDTSRSRG